MKIRNKVQSLLAMAVVAVTAGLVTSNASAQQERQGRERRGNFDPAQMRQQVMERLREQFEVKSDDEWKVIEARLVKVQEAQRDARMGGGFGGRGGFASRRGGGDNDGGDRPRNPFGGEPAPEAEALQKAVEAKASSEELKSKLAKYREARKAKEAAVDKAQEDLRKVLSARQEATAVLMGLLK